MNFNNKVKRDAEIGDLWREPDEPEKEEFFEVENQRYQRIERKNVVVGDYILTKDGKIREILAIPPIGGYMMAYFQTKPDTHNKIGPGYLESQVLKYGRLVTDINAT